MTALDMLAEHLDRVASWQRVLDTEKPKCSSPPAYLYWLHASLGSALSATQHGAGNVPSVTASSPTWMPCSSARTDDARK